MSDKLIFVSCGQLTAEEKRLGRHVQEAIASQEGFRAYFADSVQSLATLGNHVLDALRSTLVIACGSRFTRCWPVLMRWRFSRGTSAIWRKAVPPGPCLNSP